MSFLNNVFNRKRKAPDLKLTGRNSSSDDLEEDSDEEEAPDQRRTDTDPKLSENTEAEETYEVVEREIHPAKIICPDCGGITLEGLEFCDKCGGELL